MQIIKFMFLSIFFLSCSTAKKITMKATALNGTWIPVKQELGGKELPAAAFKQQQLIISDSSYTFTAESIDKGALQYSNGKMDIYGKEGVNKGKHFTALYMYENGLLSICYNLLGNAYPEAFDTKGKPLYFLSVFKKK